MNCVQELKNQYLKTLEEFLILRQKEEDKETFNNPLTELEEERYILLVNKLKELSNKLIDFRCDYFLSEHAFTYEM